MKGLTKYFPILEWGRQYNRATLTSDLVAACIVTIMLIPQSLAYALLAGLPAEAGLHASLLPLVAYGLFGTSRTLAVGPVAVVSLMTAAAIGSLGVLETTDKLLAAACLALMSGLMLIALGVLRLGFLANFLSHPVIAGFITASGIIIALSQMKHLLGINASGDNLVHLLQGLLAHLDQINFPTLVIGISATAFLFWVRKGLQPLLLKFGMAKRNAELASKTGPVFAVVVTTLTAYLLDLGSLGVALVGDVPSQLPGFSLPNISTDFWLALAGPAALISIIGFVESVSVAQTLAAKRRQRIDPNQELIALGAANVSAGSTQGFPVTGGFSRSVVNFDAGAETPAAGIYTAVGIAIATLLLTPLLAYLPKATLAATIIVAVLSLVDLSILKKTWRYSQADFIAVSATILVTLVLGVEFGVSAGVLLSILIFLLKTSRPHMAIVGQVEGTEHYRNIDRHQVITHPNILSVRVDESLYFANAHYLEDQIDNLAAERPPLQHVILMCTAVNTIDMSALESLEALNSRLSDRGIKLHLSEIKGPVMDKLKHTEFMSHLTGNIYLTQHRAVSDLVEQDYCI
ncbi:SulP family inorganic anion transporter [Hahella ganghwensis]|uniref:SulP family inorganic anion transporter n=1 Tax=Hahella ganghwensis TaxID=286420 RepID=UPI0003710C53|nr:sulfate permease [Hahella ganghwensis]